MMWLLTDRLPTTVNINGSPFEAETDFRLFVAFKRAAFLGQWHEKEAYKTMYQFYKGRIPADVNTATDAFFDFFNQGHFKPIDTDGNVNYPSGGKDAIPYAFDLDDRRIYAAFRQEYGIDLAIDSLHWFAFSALLEALFAPSFSDIVGYRVMDLSEVQKEARKHLAKLQHGYEIESPGRSNKKVDLDTWAAGIKAKLEGGG